MNSRFEPVFQEFRPGETCGLGEWGVGTWEKIREIMASEMMGMSSMRCGCG